MKGQVLDFSVQKNEGIISVADDKRYAFAGSEWRDAEQPLRGMWVDFEADGDHAKGIFRALSETTVARPRSKSKAAATLWAILLGGFGAHKFYMGSWGWGLVYLLTCWLYLPFLVAFVEWIRYVLMTDDEFYAKTESFYRQKTGPFGFFW